MGLAGAATAMRSPGLRAGGQIRVCLGGRSFFFFGSEIVMALAKRFFQLPDIAL